MARQAQKIIHACFSRPPPFCWSGGSGTVTVAPKGMPEEGEAEKRRCLGLVCSPHTHGGSVPGELERRAIRLVTRHRHRQSRHRFQGPSMWAVAGRPLRFGAKVFALQTTLVRIVAGFVGLGRSGGVGVGGGARPWRRACANQRRGDCGEEIVEARLLQRSWSLRSSWRSSSIFEMEVVAYESVTKLKALELYQRKRREHRWRHAVAERVMVAAVRMACFFHRHVMEHSSMRGRCLAFECCKLRRASHWFRLCGSPGLEMPGDAQCGRWVELQGSQGPMTVEVHLSMLPGWRL
jgi:hypothetical protein